MSRLFPADSVASLLQQGVRELDLNLQPGIIDACLAYLQLLEQWNRAYNLTAIREFPRMVSHHVLDSLSALPFLRGHECLDVGTGAGLPGMILALADPRRHWVLLDSNHKKIRFVNQVKLELGLENVETVCQRTEAYTAPVDIGTITCRAYASLDQIVRQTNHLLSAGTCLLALKNADCSGEVRALQGGNLRLQTHPVRVPGINEDRCIVEIRALPP